MNLNWRENQTSWQRTWRSAANLLTLYGLLSLLFFFKQKYAYIALRTPFPSVIKPTLSRPLPTQSWTKAMRHGSAHRVIWCAFSQFKFLHWKWLLLVSNWHTSSHRTISPALRAFLRSVWCQNCSHKIFMRKTVHLLFFVIILTIRVWVVKHMLRCNFPVNVFLLFVFKSYKCILFCITDNTNFLFGFCWLYLPWIRNGFQSLYSVIFSQSFVQ